ncbi:hypothetical protein LIA77_05880 [Sarocladium implicatum]|nr:hypothetical protein LIA77_05880 [Sarocladium implicatum]
MSRIPGGFNAPMLPKREMSIRSRYLNVPWTHLLATIPSASGRTQRPEPGVRSRRVAHAYPLSLFNRSGAMEEQPDLELGCGPWHDQADRTGQTWFKSKLKRKARDPMSCDSINYEPFRMQPVWKLVTYAPLMALWCVFVPILVEWMTKLQTVTGISILPSEDFFAGALVWMQCFLSMMMLYLYSMGLNNLGGARAGMLAIRHCIVNMVYTLQMSMADGKDRHSSDILPIVYEFLCLLTAYPVALLQQYKGNTCEPDVPRYCKETALAFYRMRDGDGSDPTRNGHTADRARVGKHSREDDRGEMDCFFEVFSLHLEMEYAKHDMVTQLPSLIPEYIVHNLRSHAENLEDSHCFKQVPLVREQIDNIAAMGRQLIISSFNDIHPKALLWTFVILSRFAILASPLQLALAVQGPIELGMTAPEASQPQCTTYQDERDASTSHICWLPASVILLSCLAGALGLAIVDEVLECWDPFGRGLNTFAWTLGIAMEIDTMLHDFYETDDDAVVRKVSFKMPDGLGRRRVRGPVEHCSRGTVSDSTFASGQPQRTRSHEPSAGDEQASVDSRAFTA